MFGGFTMKRIIYFEDEDTVFQECFQSELVKNGVAKEAIEMYIWQNFAPQYRNADKEINWASLISNINLSKFTIALFDVMMPPAGLPGSDGGLLSGMQLHMHLSEQKFEYPCLLRGNAIFLTNLPETSGPDSKYAELSEYSMRYNCILIKKGLGPEKIALKVCNLLNNNC
jgi:hypothetical protein